MQALCYQTSPRLSAFRFEYADSLFHVADFSICERYLHILVVEDLLRSELGFPQRLAERSRYLGLQSGRWRWSAVRRQAAEAAEQLQPSEPAEVRARKRCRCGRLGGLATLIVLAAVVLVIRGLNRYQL